MSNWISVKDALPEEFKHVLVCRRSKYGERLVEDGYYAGGGRWKTHGEWTHSVSHWMPLPPVPEVSE